MSKEETVELEGILEGESGTVEEGNEYSPAEEKAMASGWRPQDEWTGDPDDWVDARTFNRNGEFMSRIQQQSKQLNSSASEIEELKNAMKALGDHNKKIAEAEFKKAVASLKKEKVAALEGDDHELVVEIDDKIDELKETKREMDAKPKQELEKPPADVAPDPVFVEWSATNTWYKNDTVMRGAADALGMEYADKNQGAPLADVLDYVTKQMATKFPQEFGNKNQRKPSPVTEGSASGSKRGKKAKFTEKDLSDEQKQFAKMFVDTGAFDSVQEYVDQLVESGDL